MELKRLLHDFLEYLSWFAFIVLAIGLVYFVREVWESFISGKTNARVYTEEKESFQHPTITICFEPQINANELKKYNLSVKDILTPKGNPNLNIPSPIINFVKDIGYKIGRDFNLELRLKTVENRPINVKLNKNTLSQKLNYVHMEQLIGNYHGTCTVIKVRKDIMTPAQAQSQMSLILGKNVVETISRVKIIFTSESNYHGVLAYQWMEGQKYELLINPSDSFIYSVNLQQENRIMYPGKSNCSKTVGYYKCLANQ